MTENEKSNGADKVLDVGAIIPLDDEVLKHGVLFTHPRIPAFLLKFKLLKDGKLKYYFEPVGGVPTAKIEENTLVLPENKIILPEGNA